MKSKRIAYWVTTVILAFVLLSGGAAQLMKHPQNVEGMIRLGYPIYFLAILGAWKILGGIAILVPRFPRLKEWAYAGAVFDLTGAAISHAVRGSVAGHVIGPLLFAACALASWALRPSGRILGTILPPRDSGKN